MDIDGGRSFDRIQSNAGNIGFAASVPTGMNDISVNVRCEQFTYFNHFAGGTGWCNRNSKIGLSHPQMGEIMFATWLLPYNEGVAQWVDPFYDAGADSHTSIMGSVGANTIFYNTGDFDMQSHSFLSGRWLSRLTRWQGLSSTTRGCQLRHGLQPSSGKHHSVLVAELERFRVPLRVDRRQPVTRLQAPERAMKSIR